jgi:hypothetical protein
VAAALAVTPAEEAWRFACSVFLGMALGPGYDLLRPLGSRHPDLADLLFAPLLLWVWLYVSFAVCRCDIRMVYTLGMLGGFCLWELTAARWLQPLCFLFWQKTGACVRFFLVPWKNFLKFVKILFASAKKWVTIKCTKVLKVPKTRRKESNGKQERNPQTSEGGNPSVIQYP